MSAVARFCATHTDREACLTCPRCGDFACAHCVLAVGDRSLCWACAGLTPLPVVGTVGQALRLLFARWRRALSIAVGPMLLSTVPLVVTRVWTDRPRQWSLGIAFLAPLWQLAVGALLAVPWYREVLLGSGSARAPADAELGRHCLRHAGVDLALALPAGALALLLLQGSAAVQFMPDWIPAVDPFEVVRAVTIAEPALTLLMALLLARARLLLPSIAVDGPHLGVVWRRAKGSSIRIFLLVSLLPFLCRKSISILDSWLSLDVLWLVPVRHAITLLGLTTLALAYRHLIQTGCD